MTTANDLASQLKGFSHHAYCLVGSDPVKAELISILGKAYKVKTHGNPDFFGYCYETFTIDDARAIKSLASTRPVTEASNQPLPTLPSIEGRARVGLCDGGVGRKFFVLQMNGITIEAQNALLKLLEEPPEYAHLFLVIPSAHLLLPTVRSRMSVIQIENRKEQIVKGSGKDSDRLEFNAVARAEEFVKLSIQKRLDLVKTLMEDISKEKRPKQDAIDLINAIQEDVHSRAHSKADLKDGLAKDLKALEAIETARTYMNDRAPSLKMLLEYVALSI